MQVRSGYHIPVERDRSCMALVGRSVGVSPPIPYPQKWGGDGVGVLHDKLLKTLQKIWKKIPEL